MRSAPHQQGLCNRDVETCESTQLITSQSVDANVDKETGQFVVDRGRSARARPPQFCTCVNPGRTELISLNPPPRPHKLLLCVNYCLAPPALATKETIIKLAIWHLDQTTVVVFFTLDLSDTVSNLLYSEHGARRPTHVYLSDCA